MRMGEGLFLVLDFVFFALLLRLSVDDIRTGFLRNKLVALLAAAGLVMVLFG